LRGAHASSRSVFDGRGVDSSIDDEVLVGGGGWRQHGWHLSSDGGWGMVGAGGGAAGGR
jgi:hypothetical protein